MRVGALLVSAITAQGPEELMKKLSVYDASAKSSMDQIQEWTAREGSSLPLFPNLIENPDASRKPNICVGIQTSLRPNSPFSYLRQTVAAMLARMDFPSTDEVYIHAFGLKGKGGLASVSALIPVTEVDLADARTMRTVLQQSRLHARVLRQLQGIGCQHIVMLEDDALATFDWVDRVKDAITQANARHIDWLMVKLFTARPPGDRAWTRGLNSYDQRFGAVAYLINNAHVTAFADMLDAAVADAQAGNAVRPEVDLVIIQFTDTRGKAVLAFEPVVFQHTGIFSAANPGRTPAEFAAHWGMQSRDFAAEGRAIQFRPERWAKRKTSRLGRESAQRQVSLTVAQV